MWGLTMSGCRLARHLIAECEHLDGAVFGVDPLGVLGIAVFPLTIFLVEVYHVGDRHHRKWGTETNAPAYLVADCVLVIILDSQDTHSATYRTIIGKLDSDCLTERSWR